MKKRSYTHPLRPGKRPHGISSADRTGWYVERRVERLERLIENMAERMNGMLQWYERARRMAYRTPARRGILKHLDS